jgi:hypothetical protein
MHICQRIVAVGIVAVALSLTACGGSSRGREAYWTLKSRADVTSASQSFTEYVSRIECSGGVTGAIREPAVRVEASRVVVTFTATRLPSGSDTCPGNHPVPYTVKLSGPISKRSLVDGVCGPGSDVSSSAECVDGGLRWKPAPKLPICARRNTPERALCVRRKGRG